MICIFFLPYCSNPVPLVYRKFRATIQARRCAGKGGLIKLTRVLDLLEHQRQIYQGSPCRTTLVEKINAFLGNLSFPGRVRISLLEVDEYTIPDGPARVIIETVSRATVSDGTEGQKILQIISERNHRNLLLDPIWGEWVVVSLEVF